VPITREDVYWAYQTFLGRLPESEENISYFMSAMDDVKSLVATFLASEEYRGVRNSHVIDGFTYDDSAETQATVLGILRMLEPVRICGLSKVRVGGTRDGGYVMLDDFANIDAAYSLGIKDDVSWDLDIAVRDIDVFQYDHTIDKLPLEHPRFQWFKTGIAASPSDSFDSLQNLIVANGHANCRNLLLKCDIEGAEWEMFDSMPIKNVEQFRQIVVEMHGWQGLRTPDFADLVRRVILKIVAHHRLVHVHGNNNRALAVIGGVAVPATMEMTFARLDDKGFLPSDETFPTPLDAPCWPYRADYHLGTFRF
jgi:hypothetical protein